MMVEMLGLRSGLNDSRAFEKSLNARCSDSMGYCDTIDRLWNLRMVMRDSKCYLTSKAVSTVGTCLGDIVV